MKVKFLGTSAAWPIPRLNCHCELCSSTNPKDKRKRSCVLINDKLLLDAGYDIYEQIKNESLTQLGAVAVTHEHPDHTAGLPDLDHIYNHPDPVKLFINRKTWNKIQRVFQWKSEIVFAESFITYQLNELTFSFLPVIHTDSAFGILVEESGKKFFYAPDMGGLPAETKEKIKKIDLAAFDGSSAVSKGGSRGHQSMQQGIKLTAELKFKKTYFTHIGHLTLPIIKQERKLAKLGAKNVTLAYDGLEIVL